MISGIRGVLGLDSGGRFGAVVSLQPTAARRPIAANAVRRREESMGFSGESLVMKASAPASRIENTGQSWPGCLPERSLTVLLP